MAFLPEDPQTRRNALLGAVMLLALGYFGYDRLYAPRVEEVALLEQRLEQLEVRNRAARVLAASDGRSDVEQRLEQYRRQLVRVEGLIPSSEELPDLLDAISAEARRTGVDLALIQPVGATVEQFYVRRTYDLAVIGSYHQIGEFLTRIASLPRIITPSNLNLAVQQADATGQPRLEARFSIETYVLPTDSPTPDTANAE